MWPRVQFRFNIFHITKGKTTDKDQSLAPSNVTNTWLVKTTLDVSILWVTATNCTDIFPYPRVWACTVCLDKLSELCLSSTAVMSHIQLMTGEMREIVFLRFFSFYRRRILTVFRSWLLFDMFLFERNILKDYCSALQTVSRSWRVFGKGWSIRCRNAGNLKYWKSAISYVSSFDVFLMDWTTRPVFYELSLLLEVVSDVCFCLISCGL